MEIQILHNIEGAKKAKGLTVIIDVFRAFSMETYLTKNHAEKIIPIGEIETAFEYKKANPDVVLCGERRGIKVEGFDHGNSPAQIENIDFTGKTVIHTTSAGTQGIVNATGADEIIGGNLVCAKAIADYIQYKNPEYVSLVCMGLMGCRKTDEDTLCAEYIKSRLEGKPLEDIEERIEALKLTSGAQFFKPELSSVFPEKDFELCTRINSFPFVLRLKKDENGGPSYMERVDIETLDKNYVADEAKVVIPEIKPGDMASSLTREQAICLPDDIKKVLVYGNYKDPEGNFDAALVLGGNGAVMESRAKAAAKLYRSGQCSLFITTGGVYQDTPFGFIPEHRALAEFLIKEGVPEDCIIEEDKATTTLENMTLSRQLITERLGSKKIRLAVVTSYFHVVRSVKLAENHIENADIVGVKADFPYDNPDEFHMNKAMVASVKTESRLLCSYAKRGIIKDFPILHI